MHVIDIHDPTHPRRVGGNSVFRADAVEAANGQVYLGTINHGLVILDLYQPPRLESPQLHPEGFHLTLRGVTGQIMRLERSRNLLDWEMAATVPVPTSGQTLIDPAATTEPFLFYRAVSVP